MKHIHPLLTPGEVEFLQEKSLEGAGGTFDIYGNQLERPPVPVVVFATPHCAPCRGELAEHPELLGVGYWWDGEDLYLDQVCVLPVNHPEFDQLIKLVPETEKEVAVIHPGGDVTCGPLEGQIALVLNV